MKNYMFIAATAMTAFLLSGCAQQLVYREYYEPTETTHTVREDGSVTGAVKTEASKDGAPDWSDAKSFNLSVFGIGN